MNAKKCKVLRARARELTVGLPIVSYKRHKHHDQVIVDPQTTRGLYLLLKRTVV